MKTRNTLTATAVFLIVAILGALVLGAAVIVGAPISPAEIEGLMHAMHQQEIAEAFRGEDDRVILQVANPESSNPTYRTSCRSQFTVLALDRRGSVGVGLSVRGRLGRGPEVPTA